MHSKKDSVNDNRIKDSTKESQYDIIIIIIIIIHRLDTISAYYRKSDKFDVTISRSAR